MLSKWGGKDEGEEADTQDVGKVLAGLLLKPEHRGSAPPGGQFQQWPQGAACIPVIRAQQFLADDVSIPLWGQGSRRRSWGWGGDLQSLEIQPLSPFGFLLEFPCLFPGTPAFPPSPQRVCPAPAK